MSHPIASQDYPCETCGEQPHDCECEQPKNQFEIAADAYVAEAGTDRFEIALRQAFYAGVQFGIETVTKVYRPELSK